jgi:hypothetical protein
MIASSPSLAGVLTVGLVLWFAIGGQAARIRYRTPLTRMVRTATPVDCP